MFAHTSKSVNKPNHSSTATILKQHSELTTDVNMLIVVANR